MAKTKDNNTKEEPIEKQLWKSADKLRKNIDAAEYKHVVLGLIFLKYISDAFEELHDKLKSGKGDYVGADPEDKDEYKAENVFFVPEIARWSYLQSKAKLPTIGKEVDNAPRTLGSCFGPPRPRLALTGSACSRRGARFPALGRAGRPAGRHGGEILPDRKRGGGNSPAGDVPIDRRTGRRADQAGEGMASAG